MGFGNVVGQVVDGKYSIEKQLGKGGMGTVYLATHIGTGRPVAVKIIAPEFMQREEFVERFRREAKAAGRLRHPNVVDVTDFGFSKMESGEDAAYLVMEYLDGCTLGEVLDEEKQLPLDFSIDILEQVCSAVEEAHKQGIIHRDLKPDNIWLEPNQRGGYTVKVLDFGIAKLEAASFEQLVEEIPYEGSIEDRELAGRKTVVEAEQTGTHVDENSATVALESDTIAIDNKSQTIVSEAGTMIQEGSAKHDEVSLEEGTAILPSNKTQALDSKDGAGTKIIDKKVDTDKRKDLQTAALTKVGAVLGTPLYMSPEQCRGEKLSHKSDIYSLSVIVYQMLSGKTPFDGDYLKVMEGHKNEDPPPLEKKKVPNKLKGIVMQSLSKDVSERPETAEALASKLRASSEGLGSLLRRAIVIYSERLPKFLLLAFLTFFPLIVLTFGRVGYNFLRGFEILGENAFTASIGGIIGISSFFLQIVTSAFLVGMTTWIVAQTLAYPLRPVSLRKAFKEVKMKWKPLTFTVTISTLLSMLSWVLGAAVGVIAAISSLPMISVFFNEKGAIAYPISASIIGALFLGVTITCLFMLITPSIMMEGVSGRSAFRRSIELAKRSFQTVFATSLLVYVIPVFLALLIGVSVGSVIKNIEMRNEITEMKREGVKPMSEEELKKEADTPVSVNRRGLNVEINRNKNGNNDKGEEKSTSKKIQASLQEGVFELIWTPIALLITSFTSVVTALIYFKTRQAGGESMEGLLGKLDDTDEPQSKWQQRVRERLIQSGKITGSPSKS
ncbi:MAG: protein kinase [Pyrinomonadaceae bacterium]|nr:protein kinase [Pyrinomonadaceae bacterium]